MKTIKLGYLDCAHSGNYNAQEDFFFKLLLQKYHIEITDNPDYLFYSVYGNNHHTFDGIRIFFTGENVVPNFNYCDYAFGFHHIEFEDRYMRLPLWRQYGKALNAALSKTPMDVEATKRKFCSMVISNIKQTDGFREEFFEKLSAYKQVDSGGKYKNNVGGPVPDKIEFQKDYKFSFAFENVAARGYCTEKILESFAAGTIPIYYGDETAVQDFNPKAFINCHDYASIDEVIEKIKQLDNDDEAYLQMLNEPAFVGGKLPEKYSDESILKFLSNIFDGPIEKARRRKIIKHYADVDYRNMKQRDVYLIVNHFMRHKMESLGRRIKKIFGKK